MRGAISILTIVLVVSGLGVMTRGRWRSPNTQMGAKPAAASDTAAARASDIHAAERARGDLLRGQAAADGRREPLVPRRAGQRDAGPHRLRAPLRAHDVPGLEARRRRHAFQAARSRRRAATSTARPTSIAPTTSRPCPRISSSSRLWLESDRMGYLLDALDQTALANQQDVVRNERRQSVENQPVRHGRRGAVPRRCIRKKHPVLRAA